MAAPHPACGIAALLALLAFIGTAAAAENWDALVAAAKGEGEVDVHGGPGKLYEQVLTDGFRRAFPPIKVVFSGSSGRDAIPQITRERAAGIYNWDVYVGGTPSILQTLMPANAFVPLRAAFVLPEITADGAWFGGLDLGWMDAGKRYVLGFEATVTAPVMVNWDFVAPDDLKRHEDLLAPRFAGKIVWDDPRLPGAGVGVGQRLLVNFGADFLQHLYADQKIIYSSNPRQEAEWLVRGQYPIGLGIAVEALAPFQQQGLGKNIAGFDLKLPHPTMSTGFGTVSMMDRAPHPSAAKLYINWLLSKAGQTDWGATGHNSRRLDVPHVDPASFPVPGTEYRADQSEAAIPSREQAAELAKKFIPAPNP
ncbi:MAG TPA: extracellular solute-binding protein [Stellaceae bacterium]|nr:extracellular solute-binding protein [Stellaceae bacterium]